jgi:hypothetical protein
MQEYSFCPCNLYHHDCHLYNIWTQHRFSRNTFIWQVGHVMLVHSSEASLSFLLTALCSSSNFEIEARSTSIYKTNNSAVTSHKGIVLLKPICWLTRQEYLWALYNSIDFDTNYWRCGWVLPETSIETQTTVLYSIG